MNLEKKNEEIIELTEVLEEGPAFAAKNNPGERLSLTPERKKDSLEGLKSQEQKAREATPRVAAEAVYPEIEALKKEVEKIQAQGEELSRRTQSWLESEGKQILEKIARELFPPMAEKILRQEIEKLKEESRSGEKE